MFEEAAHVERRDVGEGSVIAEVADEFVETITVVSLCRGCQAAATVEEEAFNDLSELHDVPPNEVVCTFKPETAPPPIKKPLHSRHPRMKRYLVGARGFEPPTSSTPLKRATELRYAPQVCDSIAE